MQRTVLVMTHRWRGVVPAKETRAGDSEASSIVLWKDRRTGNSHDQWRRQENRRNFLSHCDFLQNYSHLRRMVNTVVKINVLVHFIMNMVLFCAVPYGIS